MGQEIQQSTFTQLDQEEFAKKLREETEVLRSWFKSKAFANENDHCGLELEAWILDKNGDPMPGNDKLLPAIDDPQVVPEISRFNFEINSKPQKMEGKFLGSLEEDLRGLWYKCEQAAGKNDMEITSVGILPTVKDEHLVMKNMSAMTRYQALNAECLKLRGHKPFVINIERDESLHIEKEDVMMEAAATSLQVHLQTNQDEAADLYNLSLILSAPMVALAANAPSLYGKKLWHETRIPVFEQSVQLNSFKGLDGEQIERVTFGNGYIDDLMDLFDENLKFPVLLPYVCDKDPSWLSHLRLHNGNIWRWNRPIIGLDGKGRPHLRIEHRVNSAGPTTVDVVANTGVYLGFCKSLIGKTKDLCREIDFKTAKQNFYTAAKDGLDAELVWAGEKIPVKKLLLEELIPKAQEWFKNVSTDSSYIDQIILPRVESGQNGAVWQRDYLESNAHDYQKLMKAYLENQKTLKPVHLW